MAEDETYIHLEAHGGNLVLRAKLADDLGGNVSEWYQTLGGDAFFDRLGVEFYRLVEQDEVLSPLFHGRWADHARRFAHHFQQMYGRQRFDAAWDPHLLAVHTRMTITHEHRQRWLAHLWDAGQNLEAPQPAFTEFVGVMVIAASSMMGASRGAALERGDKIDTRGRSV